MLYAEILARLIDSPPEFLNSFTFEEWQDFREEFEEPTLLGAVPTSPTTITAYTYCTTCNTLHRSLAGFTSLYTYKCLQCTHPSKFSNLNTTEANAYRANKVLTYFPSESQAVKLAMQSILVRKNNLK